jgi:ArsR family transcriptional regulator, arsenate/arsenite/antimonite-responsive transcriptional repressor
MKKARARTREAGGQDAQVDLRPVEGPLADADLGLLAKALGHPSRVRIIRLLRLEDASSVGRLVEQLGLAQSTVSEHLRVLREAGLVMIEPESATKRYRNDIHRLRRLKALVGSL